MEVEEQASSDSTISSRLRSPRYKPVKRGKLASLQNYATFPRSNNGTPRASPRHSGNSTPHKLNHQSSLPSLSSSAPVSTNPAALSSRLAQHFRSKGEENRAEGERRRTRWDSAKYEDPTEEAARQGDVSHWDRCQPQLKGIRGKVKLGNLLASGRELEQQVVNESREREVESGRSHSQRLSQRNRKVTLRRRSMSREIATTRIRKHSMEMFQTK